MRSPTKAVLRLSLPLGLAAFWSGLIMAGHAYPAGYDWQYQTISVLLHSDENRFGYLWAWAGLELCGLAGLAWTTGLRGHLKRRIHGAYGGGVRLLQLGFACMCSAVVPDRLLPLPKGHEIIVLVAFITICVGMVRAMRLAFADSAGQPSRRRRA